MSLFCQGEGTSPSNIMTYSQSFLMLCLFVSGVEQTVLGGVAHLLNFQGSDTMSAGYYAQVPIAKRTILRISVSVNNAGESG